jgi:hypothetical protein
MCLAHAGAEEGEAKLKRVSETGEVDLRGVLIILEQVTTITIVSVNGVMQGLGGPDEDRSGGFERGGWVTPLFDNEAATFLNQVYQRADAFLFGPRTYETFADSWGAVEDPGINPIAGALNTRPKYVASTTLTDPRWANTTVSPVTSWRPSAS